LKKHREELSAYFLEYYNDEKRADEMFKQNLTDTYIKCLNTNSFNNDKKTESLFRAKNFMILSIISTLFTVIPFGINYFQKPIEEQTIKIENSINYEDELESIKEEIYKLNQNYNLNGKNKEKSTTTASSSTASTKED